MKVPFQKSHGCGNSFILIEDLRTRIHPSTAMVKRLCNSQFGIGADGLILVRPSKQADFKMLHYNSDGSRPEMCGNGIRCFAKFLWDRKLASSAILRVESAAGIIKVKRLGATAKDKLNVEVDMGTPTLSDRRLARGFNPGKVTRIGRWLFSFVSMGNPHAVTFVEKFDFDHCKEGVRIEMRRDFFPQQTNVEFCKVISPTRIKMKVWERGAGATLACGTGACAAVVAGVLRGHLKRGSITVDLEGGQLKIRWDPKSDRLLMSGPAQTVAQGFLAL